MTLHTWVNVQHVIQQVLLSEANVMLWEDAHMLISDGNSAGKTALFFFCWRNVKVTLGWDVSQQVSREKLRVLVESTNAVRRQRHVFKSDRGFVELLSDVDTLLFGGVWQERDTHAYSDHTSHSHALGGACPPLTVTHTLTYDRKSICVEKAPLHWVPNLWPCCTLRIACPTEWGTLCADCKEQTGGPESIGCQKVV